MYIYERGSIAAVVVVLAQSIGPLLEESRAEYDYLSGLNVALDALRQETIKPELVSSARDIQDEIENHLNPQKTISSKQRSGQPKVNIRTCEHCA